MFHGDFVNPMLVHRVPNHTFLLHVQYRNNIDLLKETNIFVSVISPLRNPVPKQNI